MRGIDHVLNTYPTFCVYFTTCSCYKMTEANDGKRDHIIHFVLPNIYIHICLRDSHVECTFLKTLITN